MRQTIQTEINGTKYEIIQFGAHTQRQILFRILRLIGGGATELKQRTTAETVALLETAVEKILSALDIGEIDEIVRQCAEHSQIVLRADTGLEIKQPLQQSFDDHFAGGRLLDQGLWLFEVLNLNYADFLADLSGPKGAASIGAVVSRFKSRKP